MRDKSDKDIAEKTDRVPEDDIIHRYKRALACFFYGQEYGLVGGSGLVMVLGLVMVRVLCCLVLSCVAL